MAGTEHRIATRLREQRIGTTIPVVGGVVEELNLAAVFTGQGAASVVLRATRYLAVELTATGQVVSTVNPERELPASTITGVGAITANITRTGHLDAAFAGVGAAAGGLTGGNTLDAILTATGAISTALNVNHAQTVTVAGVGTAAATLSAGRAISGAAVGVGDAQATLTANRNITAALSGTGVAAATLTVNRNIDAELVATGAASGTIQTGGTQVGGYFGHTPFGGYALGGSGV